MFWNYRTLREEYTCQSGEIDITYVIVEAYYDEEISSVVPTSYGDTSLSTCSGNVEELGWTLDKMREALTRPVLVMRDGKLEEWKEPTDAETQERDAR